MPTTQFPCLPLGGLRRTTSWSQLVLTLRHINSCKPPTSSPTPYQFTSPMIPHPSPSPCMKMSNGLTSLSTASPPELLHPTGLTPLLSACRHSWQITLPSIPSTSCSPILGEGTVNIHCEVSLISRGCIQGSLRGISVIAFGQKDPLHLRALWGPLALEAEAAWPSCTFHICLIVPLMIHPLVVMITPYLSQDTTYCYQHCKGILIFHFFPSSFTSNHAGPDYFSLLNLHSPHTASSDSYLEPHHVYCHMDSLDSLLSSFLSP